MLEPILDRWDRLNKKGKGFVIAIVVVVIIAIAKAV
tara:strand:- start:301 stop:408 length:108 start_codon:yes stop_codon:yes gene_type:complete